ncbi:hypothetical protein ACVFYP_21505 [Roseomonas sp. F4]
MRSLLPLLLAASFVVGCAAKPPGPITVAERARPHALIIAAAPTSIPVDGDTGYAVPGFVALSPAAAIGGFIGQAIVAAIEAPAAQRRADRQAALTSVSGDTAPSAAVFATTFDAALATWMQGVEGFRILPTITDGSAVPPPSEAVPINVKRDAVFAVHGRMVIGRARVSYRAPDATGTPASRNFLVFSEAIEAADDAHAMALWQENEGRLLRLRTEEVARELAKLVHSQLLVDPEIDTRALGLVRVTLPGAGLIDGTRETRVMETVGPWILRREESRAVLLQVVGPNFSEFVWMSVPASLLPAPPAPPAPRS